MNITAQTQGINRYGQSSDTSTTFVNTNGKLENPPSINRNGKIIILSIGNTSKTKYPINGDI